MLTLFHAPMSRSSRLVWLAEEVGADYDLHYCVIARQDGSGGRDPANPHPDGKVPALVHDGALITESAAVALYLTELYPSAGLGAAQGSTERGPFLTWLAWTAGELEPSLWAAMTGGLDNPYARSRYDAAIDRLLTALASGPYLMGARFTAADIMAGSTLLWARAHLPASEVLDAYLERITDRPAAVLARSKDGAPVSAAA